MDIDFKIGSITNIYNVFGKIVPRSAATCEDCILKSSENCSTFVLCMPFNRKDKTLIKVDTIK